MVLILYCVFLPMTRNCLNVFNCGPTDPPDGYEYMGGLREVPGAGGVHMQHPAFAFIGLYMLGIRRSSRGCCFATRRL